MGSNSKSDDSAREIPAKKSRVVKSSSKRGAAGVSKTRRGSTAEISAIKTTEAAADSPSPAPASPIAPTCSAAFSAHLRRIKIAKTRADELISEDAQPLDAHSASVALLWEIVFDRLCADVDMSASELNAIAGVIQKMASPRAKTESPKPDCDGGISVATLQDIERQLKLL